MSRHFVYRVLVTAALVALAIGSARDSEAGTIYTSVTFNVTGVQRVSDDIVGGGHVFKRGPGQLLLYGNNTYRGTTFIYEGLISLLRKGGVDSRLGTTDGPTIIYGPGALNIMHTYTYETIYAYDGSYLNGTTGTYRGPINLRGTTTFQVYNSNNTVTVRGNITAPNDTDYGINVSFFGDSSRTLVLSGSNVYWGATRVNSGGTLKAASAQAIPNASRVELYGTLDLDGYTQIIGSLSGSGTVNLGNRYLNLGNDNSSTSFSGRITGTGGVAKNGTGKQTLTGANSYSGGTWVYGGTLEGDNDGLQGSIVNNTTVVFNHNGTGTYSGVMSGPGRLVKNGSGTHILTGANIYYGATEINTGALRLGSHERISNSSPITVAAMGTFDLNGYTETIHSISGAGRVTLGSGHLNVLNSGASGFDGTISGAGQLVVSSPVTFEGPATLDVGSLSNAGTLRGSAGRTLTIRNATVDNQGTMEAVSGGVLSLDGAEVVMHGRSLFADAGSRVEYANTTVENGQLTRSGDGGHLVTGESLFRDTTVAGGAVLETAAMTTLENVTNQGTVVNNAGPGAAAIMTIIGGSNSGVLEVHGTTTIQPDAAAVPWAHTGTVNVSGSEAALFVKQHGVVDQGAKVTVIGPGAAWTNNLADDSSLLSVYVAGDGTGPGTTGEIALTSRAGLVVGEKLRIWGDGGAAGKVTLDNRCRLVCPLTEVIGPAAVLELRNSSAIYGDVYLDRGLGYSKDGTSRVFGTVTGGSTITVEGGTLIIGEEGNVSDFDFEGDVIVHNGGVLDIRDKDLAYLGASTTLSNGAIVAQNGFSVDGSDTIEGYGVIVGDVVGENAGAGLLIAAPTGTVDLTGTLEIGSATAMVYSQGEAELGEGTIIDGGTIIAEQGLRIGNGETLAGTGTIEATVTNQGQIVVPDNAAGSLTIVGDYQADEGAALVFEIGDPDGGGGESLLDITGTGTLFGEIVFRFTDGYAPDEGDQFTCPIQMSGGSQVEVAFGVENLLPGFEFDAGWDPDSESFTLTANNQGHFVPEPSAFTALVSMGLMGALGYVRRRRRR